MSEPNLYFAYTALLAPELICSVAPGARFMFSAHFPGTRLCFVANGVGAVPSLEEDAEHTVWGGVFALSDADMDAITSTEKKEGREPGWSMRAIDREGNKHDCVTFVASNPTPNGATRESRPNAAYVDQIIRGARHWNLPAGWVVGLEDLLDEDHILG
ncbi:MAG TPA: hypothetical protein VIW94_00305 [Acidimicrobiia bacterium]